MNFRCATRFSVVLMLCSSLLAADDQPAVQSKVSAPAEQRAASTAAQRYGTWGVDLAGMDRPA